MERISEVENLKKSYREKKVLGIDSLDIQEEAIYGLIDKNEANKSTLMKLILGLVKKDEGVVKIFGQEVGPKNQKDLDESLGTLIENPSFYDHLTGYENLETICQLEGIPKEEISKTLDLIDLKNLGKKKAREYSLDMKQRLGIAMALIRNPKLLILDEPINGLDPQGIEKMRNLLRDIVKNTSASILISSRILDGIEKTSNHIGILKDGKLTYNGSLESYRRLHPPSISLVTSDSKRALDLLDLPEDRTRGEEIVLDRMSNQEIADMVNLLHGKLDICKIEEEKESLEKLFIQESRS